MNLVTSKIFGSPFPQLLITAFIAVLIQGNHVANSATVAIQTRGDGDSEAAQNTALQPHLVTSGQHTNTTSEPESKLEPSVSQSPPTEKAVEGENLVFSCQFTQSGHFDSSNLSVKWYNKKSEETLTVLVGNETKEEGYSGRVFLNGDWLGTGVASMTLLNVTSSDYGIYICSVTLPDGSTLEGDGTKLSVRKRSGLFGMEESIGTIIGVVAAAVGVTVGLVAIIVPQFRKKLMCFKK